MLEFTVPLIYLLELLCPSLSSAASQQTNQSTHIHKFGHIWHTHPQQHTHTPKYLYRLVWVHIYRIPRMHVGRIENRLHIISASLTSNLKSVYLFGFLLGCFLRPRISFVSKRGAEKGSCLSCGPVEPTAPIGSTPRQSYQNQSRWTCRPGRSPCPTLFFFLFGGKKPCKIQNPSHVWGLHKKNGYIDITIITVQNQNPTNPNKNQSGWLHKNKD